MFKFLKAYVFDVFIAKYGTYTSSYIIWNSSFRIMRILMFGSFISVKSFEFFFITKTFKNGSLVSLLSKVNLMMGSKLFKFWWNMTKLSSLLFHKLKQSSKNRFNWSGFFFFPVFVRVVFLQGIWRMLVQPLSPLQYLSLVNNDFFPNTKVLVWRIISNPSSINSWIKRS